MADKPWIKFYPSDWLTGTLSLTPEERSVYITTLMLIYDSPRGAVENNPKRLAPLNGMTVRKFTSTLNALIEAGKFFEKNGKILNEKSTKILKNRALRRAQNTKAIQARWRKHNEEKSDTCDIRTYYKRNTNGYADVIQTDPFRIPSRITIPETRNQKPEPPPNPPYPSSEPEPTSPAGAESVVVDLRERIFEITGADYTTHAGWHGVDVAIGRWLAEGGTPELIAATVRGVMARRDGPPNGPKYFDQPISRAIREAAGGSEPVAVTAAALVPPELMFEGREPYAGRAVRLLPERADELFAEASAHGEAAACRLAMRLLAEAGHDV